MPQPAWFNTATFYEQKAIECNLIKYLDRTDWTPESVAGYLESLEITPYENFVDSANRENVSPSQYFNVAEYLQAKADQLNAMNDGAGYQNKTDWNQQSVLQAFDAANLSAWDHFTVAGQFENVNPSNSFDIGAFWAAKLASLSNDYVGGYEGRQWTLEQMQDVFRDLNINAIENVPDNPGGGASLVSAVPADKQVSRGIFSFPARPELLPGQQYRFLGSDGKSGYPAWFLAAPDSPARIRQRCAGNLADQAGRDS